MKEQVIHVVGHRNPDTDSICSAIAYARLRAAQGLAGVRPARAGNLNRQTEFVLKHIGVEAPPLLADVSPRVRDVVSSRLVTVEEGAPLAHALELFHQHDIRLLPVVDADRRPQGLLVLKKVSERFLLPRRESEIRRVQASVGSICRCLQARVVEGELDEGVDDFNLFVGAMATKTFNAKIAGIDPRRMILVTGDREEIQLEGVTAGIRLIVVTGGLPVSEEVRKIAAKNGVTVLSTPFDTASSTWLIRLSTPAHLLGGNDFPTADLQERLDDLRLKLLHSPYPGVVVFDGEGRVAAVATKSNLLNPSNVKLILVDHNELSQAVPGADKVEILEVVDHHRLGNFHTDAPIRFINQPVGSTCTLVATLYRDAGVTPDAQTAGLLLSGLLSDTVILKSPTTTDVDREIAAWLGDRAGLDPAEYGRQLFAASSALAAYPTLRELILADFKEYAAGEESFGVGQVEVVSFAEFQTMKGDLLAELTRLKDERSLGAAGLLVTDIVSETSLLLAVGGKELPYVIGYPQLEPHLFELRGVLSRKKQLVPHLLKVFKG